MGLINDVLVNTRAGHTPARTAVALGVDVGLVNGALDHLERLGMVSTAGTATGSPCAACPDTEQQALACAGCFFKAPVVPAQRRRWRKEKVADTAKGSDTSTDRTACPSTMA